MDALEFLKERKRMCYLYNGCLECPLESGDCTIDFSRHDVYYERIVTAVEKWSKEHPRKTKQSVFLEQFPETALDELGVITICPAVLSCDYRSSGGGCKHPGVACRDCRREFWMQEIE